jgi:catechol 2,3-dioxygenase-like lactoylglutathione lyase family enzyme
VAIDHLTVPVRDYEAAKRFYEQALAPLGFVVLLDWPDERRAYLGLPGRPSSLWLVEAPSAGGLDFCLAAPDADAVAAFQAEALAAGGRPTGDAARVFDLDGNSLEAVYRAETALRAA